MNDVKHNILYRLLATQNAKTLPEAHQKTVALTRLILVKDFRSVASRTKKQNTPIVAGIFQFETVFMKNVLLFFFLVHPSLVTQIKNSHTSISLPDSYCNGI